MESGNTLIEAAARVAGSRYKLAMKLGESQSFLSHIEHGKKRMPPSLAARMAAIAGVDARRAAMEALVSQEKDHEKAVALANALGVPAPPEPEISNGLTVQLA